MERSVEQRNDSYLLEEGLTISDIFFSKVLPRLHPFLSPLFFRKEITRALLPFRSAPFLCVVDVSRLH